MTRKTRFSSVLLLVLGAACGKEVDPEVESRCEQYAEHLADVIAEEKRADDIEIDATTRANAIEKTREACLGAGLDVKQLECALAAESTAQMRKCDDEKKSEGA
jgi:hypothetical protein